MIILTRNESVKNFVDELAAVAGTTALRNPYHADEPFAEARCWNLRVYLERMGAYKPRWLLVGEALGYRGGGTTGVPFAAAGLLQSHPFFEGDDYQLPQAWKTRREATSTIMWGVLSDLPHVPLLWNALPFHPHPAGKRAGNRTPKRDELRYGVGWLQRLMALFDIRQVVAVGNSAETALKLTHIPCLKVRHPSHGGKRAFQAGLEKISNENTFNRHP